MKQHWNSSSLRSKNLDVTFKSVGTDCTKNKSHEMIGYRIEVKSDHLTKTDLIRLRNLLNKVIKSTF